MRFSVLVLFCSSLFCLERSNIGFFTVPKSGTHLIQKCVNQLLVHYGDRFKHDNRFIESDYSTYATLTRNTYYVGFSGYGAYCAHFWNPLALIEIADNAPDLRVFVIYRDPRDVCCSLSKYIDNFRYDSGYLRGWGWKYEEWMKKSDVEKLSKIICDAGYRQQYQGVIELSSRLNVCLVKFENLVGVRGGGNDLLQFREVKKISEFLGIHLSEAEIKRESESLFGGARVFYKGQIGRYKEVLAPIHYDQMEESFGKEFLDELIQRTSISHKEE